MLTSFRREVCVPSAIHTTSVHSPPDLWHDLQGSHALKGCRSSVLRSGGLGDHKIDVNGVITKIRLLLSKLTTVLSKRVILRHEFGLSCGHG